MAKDYARRRTAPPPAQVPSWMFLLVGIIIGAVLMGLYVTRGGKEPVSSLLPKTAPAPQAAAPAPSPAPAPAPAAAKPEPKPEPKAEAKPEHKPDPKAEKKPEEKKPEEKKPDEKKIDYTFYNVLPEQEVPVSEDPKKGQPAQPQALPAGKYIVQVGAFPTAKEAEEHKAMIAMTIGETASIQTVAVDGKPTWHRVRLGPYTDPKALEKLRQKLNGNGVKHVVLKEGP